MRDSALGWAVAIVLAALVGRAGADAFQGMGRTSRPPRPARVIETDLPPIKVDYRDLAEQAGLTAPVISGRENQKRYILEATGTGVAIFDFDNDRLMDVFVASATTLDTGDAANTPSRLYRNLGQLRFADVTAKAGLDRSGWAQGVCVGDFDNDSHRDLFVTHYGQSVLYRNRGDGTFEENGLLSGAALNADGQEQGGMGVAVADYDEDGHVDIAKTNFSDDVPNLYRNNGDGSFDDRVYQSGLGGYTQYVGWASTSPMSITTASKTADDQRARVSRSRAAARAAIPPAAAAVLERGRPVQGSVRRGGPRHA